MFQELITKIFKMFSTEAINDDDNWSPSTEFKVQLTHPQNCKRLSGN